MKLNFNGVPSITPAQYDAIRRQLRFDGWKSALSGVGYASFDKRETVTFEADLVTIPEAREMWRGDDLAKRIIETVPSESVREGFKFCAGEDSKALDIAEMVMEEWKRLSAYQNIKMGRCFERAYGGGAILLGVDDGQKDWSKPLNLKAVRGIHSLTWFEPDELMPVRWYSNWKKPKFRRPALFQLNPYTYGAAYEEERDLAPITGSEYVHESRLIQFDGIRIGSNVGLSMNGGWGDNVLTLSKRTLRDFNMSWSSASVLVMEFATPIFKMKGLDQLIAMDRDDEFKRRIQAAQLARSVLRAMLIDAEEEFTREQTPVSGLPELLDRFATRLAAAADMPVTLLMGQSPAGLNATGESDIRFFYDRTKGSQIIHEVPALQAISKVIMAANGIEPPKTWSIEPLPLWQPSEKEQADTRKVQADTDAIYLDRSVISPEQVKKNRFTADGGSYSTYIEEENEDDGELPLDIREVPGQEGTEDMGKLDVVKQAYDIVAGIGRGEISPEAGKQIFISFFGMDEAAASEMATDFEGSAAPPPTPPVGNESPKPGEEQTEEKEQPPGKKSPPFGKKPPGHFDWDPDQPRAENSQFGEGGGGGGKDEKGGSDKPKEEKPRDIIQLLRASHAARLAGKHEEADRLEREIQEDANRGMAQARENGRQWAAKQGTKEINVELKPGEGLPRGTEKGGGGSSDKGGGVNSRGKATTEAQSPPAEKPAHVQHAERARAHEAAAKEAAAKGDLRTATAEAKRATAAFKVATQAATKQESKNEAKARRARDRRERSKQEAAQQGPTPEQIAAHNERQRIAAEKSGQTFGSSYTPAELREERAQERQTNSVTRELKRESSPRSSASEGKARRAAERREAKRQGISVEQHRANKAAGK